MARAHRIAAIVNNQTREDRRRPGSGALSLNGSFGKVCLDGIEELSSEYRRVFAPVDHATIDDLSNIEAVLQNMRERADHKAFGHNDSAVR